MNEKTNLTVMELQKEGILLVEDGNHGEYRPRPEEFCDQGVAYIRAADMDKGRVLFESSQKITEPALKRITKGIGAPGDILLSHKGTVGKIALVPKDAPPFVCSPQTTLWRTKDEHRLNRRYLYAFMRSPGFRAQLASRAGETDMAPYVSLTSQRGLTVVLPPIKDQVRIADVLGPLDDKIEVIRQINGTLESIARALFKDWFVDFGPSRSKEVGGQRYLEPDIWGLFPDRLDETGRPKGWPEKRVEDILELAYGKALKASDRADGPIPVYGSGGITGYHNLALVNGPSVIVGRKGTVGSLYWEDRAFFPIDTVFYIRPKAPLTFCFYLLQTLGLTGMNTDAAVPGLNRANVYRLGVPWGPDELRTRFDAIVNPLRQLIRSNSVQIETLISTRDFLLPRLISGEIRIKSAERIVGESI